MTRKLEIDRTRRMLIAASTGLLVPRWMRAESQIAPVLRWKFEEKGDLALESVGKSADAIASRTGHAIWSGTGRNRGLRFDGYSVWLRHNAAPGIFRGNGITVTAWVAIESYPVNEAALLELDNKSSAIFRLSIDRLGFLQFGHHPADAKSICKSSGQVPKLQWVHLAASAGESGITLFQDGAPCGHLASGGKVKLPENITFVLGGSPDCPTAAEVFPTGIFNGLMRDACVFDSELSREAVTAIMQQGKPDGPPDLQLNGPWCVSDPQRPIAHAQPPRAWTNEPYGLIRFGGLYHIFYQKNPNGPYWGHLQWGHMTSPDLLRWTEMPVVLSPEPGFSNEGIWSGSAIVHEGKLALIYTGVDGVKAGIGVAFSEDGIHFTHDPGNPVIPGRPKWGDFLDFRDPFVWREGDTYYMLIGAGVTDVGGTVLLYKSQNLIDWEYRKQILTGHTSASGFFWEMPIFVKDGDRHALIVSELPGRATYWVGSWKDENFTPISNVPRHMELFNHLLSPTPMIEEDGQIVVMGIIPDERPPKELSRAGWAHLYSLPRSLSIDANGAIAQRPHRSVEALCHPLTSVTSIDLQDGSLRDLENIAEKSLRIRATIKRGQSKSVSLFLRRAPNGQEQTEISYDWEHGRLTLDRTKSSLDPLPRRDRQETEYTSAQHDSIHFDVFVDRSVLEVFLDDRAAFAARIYPTLDNSSGVGFSSTGPGARVENLSVARIERPA